MKRVLYLLFILCISLYGLDLKAQQESNYFDIDLWPGGLPNTNGVDHEPYDESVQNFKPSIRVFMSKKELSTGRVIIACPGGAYLGLAYKHEGYDWAPYFNSIGITYVVLKYRMPKWGHFDVPISDVKEAIRLIRENATEWKIDINNIGIMGSSAGGHLASTIATHVEEELMPAFQILFYPVITMNKEYTHKDSRESFLGKNATESMESLYSNEKQVCSTTPPAFIVLSDDDKVVDPINSIMYYLALKKSGVVASLHIYPSGGHGWGCKDSFPFKNEMQKELSSWLNNLK